MRNIVFTRGAAGAGKTTFLKESGIFEYAISPDNLRLFFQAPTMNIKGELGISQLQEKRVWELLLKVLEERMQKGEFIIIDATHTRENDFDKYKRLIEDNRYRAYVLDFSDLELEETLRRNNERGIKKAPDDIVEMMHERAVKNKIPSWINKIEISEFKNWLNVNILDLSNYKKVHHIGDLQGCFTVLEKYFSENGGIKSDEFYIFVGDYIDRGIENAKVVNFCLENFENKNFIFLEGNHDLYLWEWANGNDVKTREFAEFTKKELEENKIDKAKVRNFCRRMRTFVYYKYGDKTVFVSHGGVADIPESPKLISANEYIRGYGQYREFAEVDENFMKNSNESEYSIHGHRNNYNFPTQSFPRVFNLEGKVEFGESLRVVTLSENGFEVKETINQVFKDIPEYRVKNKIPVNFHNHFMIDKLRNNKNIIERNFPDWHISSFNFSDKVFYKKIWDRETVRARGLFVNTNTFEIVARSYEKFFNINEREDTELNFIKNKFNYPVSVYVKENGYLGILGYDSENDKLIFTSKASLDNDFAKWFTEIFLEKHESKRIEIKKYLKENNVSFVFEVVLKNKDPHIIEYSEDRLILLDIVKRDFDFSKYKYDKLLEVANSFGIEAKKLFKVLENENQFLDFYKIETERNINEEYLEGFVLEDSANFMIKVKLAYYGFWKGVRNYLEDLKIKSSPNPFFIKKGSTAVKPRKDIANEELFLDFEKWRQINFKNEEWKNKNIIELRNEFLKNKI